MSCEAIHIVSITLLQSLPPSPNYPAMFDQDTNYISLLLSINYFLPPLTRVLAAVLAVELEGDAARDRDR